MMIGKGSLPVTLPMDATIQRDFNKVLKKLDLPTPMAPSKTKGALNPRQKKDIDVMSNLLVSNLVGELETWGGTFDEAAFKDARDKIGDVLKDLSLEGKEKEIKSLFDSYTKIMKKFLERHVVATATVKTMPFKKVHMLAVPKVNMNQKGQLELNESPVGYIVELPYEIERSAAYGEMKDQKPLFAPVIGSLELAWKPSTGDAFADDEKLQYALFDVMDKQTTRNSVWRYQNYGRKGEPLCDKLMAVEDLMISMERIISEVDSKDFKANASVCGLMYAIKGKTVVAIIDFDGVHKNAFEAMFKLCAYLEEVPRAASAQQPAAGGAAGAPGAPGAGAMPTWTEEELASRPQQFAAPATPNMPVWTEEELEAREDKFSGGPNLPVWTEEELEELKKESGPSLNLPEWKEESLLDCPNCGYGCQQDWDECPVCEAKLQKQAPPPADSE